ncbi:MAG: FUSC family protein [Turicibacter sp.]|nr:FUSC family protein [Turicibacter sp.]
MKQKVIINAIMYAFILLFIMLFQGIFGATNKLVGVAVLIIGLVISEKDLTQNLSVLLLRLLMVNVAIGIFSYLTLLNPVLGFIINLFFIFYITYVTVEGNKKPYHFPFILAYLFLTLITPTTLNELPGRLIALAGGAVSIVGLQWLFNGKTYTKVLKAQLDGVLNALSLKVDRILASDDCLHAEEEVALQTRMSRFMKVTYDRLGFKGPLTEQSMKRITEIVTFEKMYYSLEDIAKDYQAGLIDQTMIEDIQLLIKDYQQGTSSTIQAVLKKWEGPESLPSLERFKETLQVLQTGEHGDYPLKKQSLFKQLLKRVDRESYAFQFAARLAILMSVALFIVQVFDLSYGRWLCLTIAALVQPGVEESRKKLLQRLVGTLVGVTIFVVLITLIKGDTMRSAVIFITAYVGMFFDRYDYKMIFITIQSLGSAIIGTTGQVVVENRIFYVLVGAVIAAIGNKFLFPIHEKDLKQHYLEEYTKSKQHLMKEPKDYPHLTIVDSYHYLQMGGIEKENYREWLNLSFNALTKFM